MKRGEDRSDGSVPISTQTIDTTPVRAPSCTAQTEVLPPTCGYQLTTPPVRLEETAPPTAVRPVGRLAEAW